MAVSLNDPNPLHPAARGSRRPEGQRGRPSSTLSSGRTRQQPRRRLRRREYTGHDADQNLASFESALAGRRNRMKGMYSSPTPSYYGGGIFLNATTVTSPV